MTARTRVVLLPLSVFLLAVVSTRPAAAQSADDSVATVTTSGAAAIAPAAGPTAQSLAVGVQRQAAQPATTVPAAARSGGLGQPEALMIVGGAALLLGAVIGDDPGTILMIGGAIVFLAGLYKYLQ